MTPLATFNRTDFGSFRRHRPAGHRTGFGHRMAAGCHGIVFSHASVFSCHSQFVANVPRQRFRHRFGTDRGGGRSGQFRGCVFPMPLFEDQCGSKAVACSERTQEIAAVIGDRLQYTCPSARTLCSVPARAHAPLMLKSGSAIPVVYTRTVIVQFTSRPE